MTPTVVTNNVCFGSTGTDTTSSAGAPVLADVPAGATVFIFVTDAYGYSNALTGVTDSQGNTYELDSAVNEADGDGSVYVASSKLDHALTGPDGDTITIEYSGGVNWPDIPIIGIAFNGVDGLDMVGTPVGVDGAPNSLSASGEATEGDLVIGVAAYQNPTVVDDTSGDWTEIYGGGVSGNTVDIDYLIAPSNGTYTYSTTSSGGEGYGAAVVLSYSPTGGSPPPPPPTTEPGTYTYWGNLNETTNGMSVIVVASGPIRVGESGVFTDDEWAYFSQICDLRQGDIPWTRTNFPWQQSGYNLFVIDGGSSSSIDTLIYDGGDSTTDGYAGIYDGGDSKGYFEWQLL